jgi:hypothetical protein
MAEIGPTCREPILPERSTTNGLAQLSDPRADGGIESAQGLSSTTSSRSTGTPPDYGARLGACERPQTPGEASPQTGEPLGRGSGRLAGRPGRPPRTAR